MHEYAKEDAKKLDSKHLWVKLEDFTSNPSDTLKKVYSFLEVPSDQATIESVLQDVGSIKKDPNAKYMLQWCESEAQKHHELIEKYNDKVKNLGLGYDLEVNCN